jgi:hypothetical protein
MTTAMSQGWTLGLSPRTVRRLLVAYLLLNGLRLGLWLLPFAQLHRLVDRLATCPQPKTDSPCSEQGQARVAQATAVLIQLVARHSPGQAKCLAQALATQVLLRRRGYRSQLHIGVARGEGDRLRAHAWVELLGAIVIGQVDDLARYRPLPSIEEVLS